MPPELDSLIRTAIGDAPFSRLHGLRIDAVEPDRVRFTLPYREAVTTIGDLVHGGAISALIDASATAAAWSGADLARGPRGTTVGFTVNFLNGARGQDVTATARVIQRGQSLVVCDVDVAGADGTAIARALVTYKLSHRDAAA